MTNLSVLLRRRGRALARLALFMLGLAVPGSAQAQAQAWPSRPVRIVVPFSVGGTTDLLARVFGKALSDATGQPFVVENKTGASGSIASAEVARAAADGHTLLLTTSSTHAIAPHVNKLPYDTVKDFTPIVHLADSDTILLAAPALGVKNVPELLALARSKPGFINYTSSGVGTFAHLAFELFAAQTGIVINHIPYKGSGSAIQDLAAGLVHLTIDATLTGAPHAKAGRVLGLAVTGPRRSIPDVPTVAETVPGYTVLIWFGIYGPGGMSPELTERIHGAFAKAMGTPELVERYKALGLYYQPGSPADFAAMVAKDSARWESVARERNIKAE
jgi:tripartite-type tricarboxylate transporter receptor subunit TctC